MNVKEKLQFYDPMFRKSESYQKLTPYVGEMQTEFQKLQCVDENRVSFWVIKGVRLFLVDKATERFIISWESGTGKRLFILKQLENRRKRMRIWFENMLLCG